MLGVAPNTAAAAMDEAERLGLAVRREGSYKRYAGTSRKGGGDSLATSTVFVLSSLAEFTGVKPAPTWSVPFLALDVVRLLSLQGRLVSLVNTDLLPEEGLDKLFKVRPAGMVVTESVNSDPLAMEALARCRQSGIPCVAYGNSPELRGYDRVYSDHRAGSRDLTRWLLAHGRRRIVPFFPFPPTRFWEFERIAGYEEAMRESGLEPAQVTPYGTAGLFEIRTEDRPLLRTSLATRALLALKLRDEGYTNMNLSF